MQKDLALAGSFADFLHRSNVAFEQAKNTPQGGGGGLDEEKQSSSAAVASVDQEETEAAELAVGGVNPRRTQRPSLSRVEMTSWI